MAATVYALCSLTSLACALLLLRGYWRSKARLLLWSSLCFALLTLNNVLLFVDKVVLPEAADIYGVNLQVLRSIVAASGLLLLLFGLIWDTE